jgi:hypothetical protein
MSDSPVIKAEFELDENGKPMRVESGGLRHYHIRLLVTDAPDDAYAVTYHLDPTYHDPVREARDRSSGFAEELTSYGDYVIQAKVRAKTGVSAVSIPLSRALEASYGAGVSAAISDALRDIRDH